jgi:hypothetical protein
MSYFPILRDKNTKNGNEFYTKFLDSIKLFEKKFGIDIYNKNIVLVKDDIRRKLTKKEIETYVKIYLLPKLYLFYSKIDYTFTLNINNYYSLYYSSLNKFNNLCRFYLNPANPIVRRVNFDIHKKIESDKKNKNSDKGFYDVIIKNNEEIIVILRLLSSFLGPLINKNKSIRKKYDSIIKLLDELEKLYNDLMTNTDRTNINNKKNNSNFQERINNMIENLDKLYLRNTKPITEAEYNNLNSKIKEYKKKYEDFLKKYQSIILILASLDIYIENFDLDKDIDFNDIKENLTSIYIKSHNKEIIYQEFLKDISSNIKKIEDINKFIDKLKSINNKNKDYKSTMDKITFDKIIFLAKIDKSKLKKGNKKSSLNTHLIFEYTNVSNYFKNKLTFEDDYFFKLLFYALAYIKNNMIHKDNFIKKPANPVNLLVIAGNNSNIVMLKSVIEELQKSLKEKEENIDEKIKNTQEKQKELEKDDLPNFVEKRYNSEITNITDINTKLDEEKKKIEGDKKTFKTEMRKLEAQKIAYLQGKAGIQTPFNDEITEFDEKIKAIDNRIIDIEKEKKANKKQIEHFTLLNFREDININLINAKINLQKELITKYDELQKSNPLKDFKQEEFINFDESLKKFNKEITKEGSKTQAACIIVSYFTQNNLYSSLFLEKNGKPKNKVSINLKDLLLMKIFSGKLKIKNKPINENKEKKTYVNEDFMEEMSKYLGNNNNFFEFLESENKKFKDIITKLLKESRRETTLKYLISSIDTDDNIEKLSTIVKSCINNEKKEYKNENRKTKIYPYTNFIIAYFAIYLIIINFCLYEISTSMNAKNAKNAENAEKATNSKANSSSSKNPLNNK